MRKVCPNIFLACIFLLSAACKNHNNYTVIKNVRLFDGENYFERVNLVFNSDSIVSISKNENLPEANTIIDGTGQTIIPPLLNAHVHVWSEKNLKEAMSAGIYALLDMHTTDSVANELRKYKDYIDCATYYSSGPGATVKGGHGTQFGISVPVIDSMVTPYKFVKERVDNGADYIKILREPVMENTINFEQTKEVIDVAHSFKKPCVAHISYLEDALVLNSQGIDGFVHIWFVKKSNSSEIQQFVKSKIFIVPTLHVIQKALQIGKRESWSKDFLTFDEVRGEVRKAYQSGIPILVGTDAPNFNFDFGPEYFNEVELLAQCGLSNIDILKSATSNVYKSFKLNAYGRIEKHAPATFILVDGDPIKSIRDLRKPKKLFRKGKLIN